MLDVIFLWTAVAGMLVGCGGCVLMCLVERGAYGVSYQMSPPTELEQAAMRALAALPEPERTQTIAEVFSGGSGGAGVSIPALCVFPGAETIEANDRSIELLKDWLTPDQRAEFERDGQFTVIGNASKKKYLITKAYSHGVKALGTKTLTPVMELCFIPIGCPGSIVGDRMLAQKIALETDEKATLKNANKRVLPGLC